MLPAFVICLREGLEAALVVSILAAYLQKTERSDEIKKLWLGVGAALAASILLGVVVTYSADALPKRGQEILEGVAGLVAVAVLTWMIFWMRRHARSLKTDLESKAASAAQSGAIFGLALLAFTAVGREGLETVLFLFAVFKSAGSGVGPAVAATAGLILAAALGYAIYKGGTRLNIRSFFQVTGGLIIVLAAGILAQSVHALNEGRVLMLLTQNAWDTTWLANPSAGGLNGVFGSILQGLIGYDPRPTVLQAIVYWAYLIPALFFFYAVPLIRARRAEKPAAPGAAEDETGSNDADTDQPASEASHLGQVAGARS